MLKGLEISEIYYSQLLSGVETLRFDSEYYLKEYVNIESFISNNRNKFSNFKDWNVNIDCSAFYPGIEPFYGKGGMPIIRVQNVKDCIDYDNCETLPLLGDKYSTLKFVNEGDIVITKGGTIGFVGYITQRAYASRDLIFVNTSTLSQEQQIYLYLYFSTNFAYKQLIRSSSQCAQPHLTITLVKSFDIYNPSNNLVVNCQRMYNQYLSKLEQSKQLYKQAEDLLLSSLGLQNWTPSNKNVSIKSFSDFVETGRLDAEYYQPKYDDIEQKIKAVGFDYLGRISTQQKSFEPGSDKYREEGVPFIRVSDLNVTGISEPAKYLNLKDFEDDLTSLMPKKDTILLSKDGSIGIAYKLDEDLEVITSGAILHLKVIDLNYLPDYVTLVLNSIVVKLQAERSSTGAVIEHWKPSEIEKVMIPKLEYGIQKQISELVQESFALRKESKQLLEDAKRMVEEEIEKGGE